MPRHTPDTARIQRRLERLELDHLRAVVAEQGQQLEEARAQLQDLVRQIQDAHYTAEQWHDNYMHLQQHLADDTDDARSIGLTKDGALLVIRNGGVH